MEETTMSNFTKITSAKYANHIIRMAARKMLLNAAYGHRELDEQARKIIMNAMWKVDGHQSLKKIEKTLDKV
jgi:hypothetical protein